MKNEMRKRINAYKVNSNRRKRKMIIKCRAVSGTDLQRCVKALEMNAILYFCAHKIQFFLWELFHT